MSDSQSCVFTCDILLKHHNMQNSFLTEVANMIVVHDGWLTSLDRCFSTAQFEVKWIALIGTAAFRGTVRPLCIKFDKLITNFDTVMNNKRFQAVSRV